MRRMGFAAAFGFLAIQLLGAVPAFAQLSQEKLEDFGRQVISDIQASNFDSLAKYFYISESYPAEHAETRKARAVGNLKKLLQDQIGSFMDITRIYISPEETIIHFQFAADNTRENPVNFAKLFYQVKFSQFGNGYIVLWIYKDKSEPEIKMIDICLPADNPKTLDIYGEFNKYLKD